MRHALYVASLFLIAAAASAAHASNLVPNPELDDGISGWSLGTATGALGIVETTGIPSAPSLRVTGDTTTPDAAALSSCIRIDESTHVDFFAYALSGAGNPVAGVQAYSDTACAAPLDSIATAPGGELPYWREIGFTDQALPAGTHSAQVVLTSEAGASGGLGDLLYDHIAFGPTGTIPGDRIALAQEGLTGTWYNPETSGQGFEFVIDPGTNGGNASLFGAWFTYDIDAGGPESQRWFSLQATFNPNDVSANVTIYQNIGGNFDSPPPTSAVAVGTGTLTFFSCESGLFTYAFDGGLEGSVPIRNLLPNVECGTTGTPPPSDFGLTGAWYDPTTSGQGILAEVNPVDAQVFVGWYTYSLGHTGGDASQQRWFSAQGAYQVNTDQMDLTVYASTGGTFDSSTGIVTTQPVGTATLTFFTCFDATLDYAFTDGELAGLSGSIGLTRLGAALESCPLAR
jgi:hypothetical protein